MAQNPPEGYHTLTPYAVVADPDAVIRFAEQVIGATVKARMEGSDGKAMHVELTVGDSMLMVGGAGDDNPPFAAMLHVYVADADAAYAAALAAGATSLRAPENAFYGDRVAGVTDSEGNQWWFATHVRDVSSDEMDWSAPEG